VELLHHRVVHLGRLDAAQVVTFRPARTDWAHAGVVTLILLALYAATAPRTVALEDDSLFVLSSYYLGIEHPPGYPIFTMIGHLFSKLPIGPVAYRVHLASALFGALTCGAAWLCARQLGLARLASWLAALALGVSPVFWSQSIIAEVYTLNTFFLLVLVYLGLRAEQDPRVLPWMALVFGLSLSNHYPLMLLAAPAFLILLWPVRMELLRRFGLLVFLVIVGLLPYLWLVRRSWAALPISFAGELDTISEIIFFISRAGYAGVDHSITAGWLDRTRYFTFVGSQLFVQFAVVGTLLGFAGFYSQWRVLGRRVSAFLTAVFLMSSVALVALLGFDYDTFRKHIFHVYPLPAYAVFALWVGLGLAWTAERYALRPGQMRAAAGGVMAVLLAAGSWVILRADDEWAARYAQTVLKILPKDAVVFGQGDADLLPMAYFHMVEGARPDLTLYQPKGLVLGNRLFHPLRTTRDQGDKILADMIEEQTDPVVFTLDAFSGYAQRERWLYIELDKSSRDPKKITVDIPEEAMRFFEASVAESSSTNAWTAYFQAILRRRYAIALAQSQPKGQPTDERTRRHYELLGRDFYGALGLAEGMMQSKSGFSASAVVGYLDRARELLPADAPKEHISRYFSLRGAVRANMHDKRGAIQDLETSVQLWPVADNSAIEPLMQLYREAGNDAALKALEERVERLKRLQRF
jgi:hypothetical protein